MPAKAADERARQRVERPHEEAVVDRSLPSAVEPRLHRKPPGHYPPVAETGQQPPEFGDAELQQHRRIVVLEADLHELRQRVEPRNPVINLKNRLAAGLQDAAALFDQPAWIARVLDNPVGVYQVKAVVGKRQVFAVGHLEGTGEPLLLEIRPGQLNRRGCQVDAGDRCAAARETREVDARAAADLQNRSAPIAVKSDEPEQVMQLLEVVLIEVVEKPAGANRMPGDFEIVNVAVPVVANRCRVCHARDYNSSFQLSALSYQLSARARAESRLPKADSRSPKADSRSPKADSRSPKADSRSPKADSRSPKADSRKLIA